MMGAWSSTALCIKFMNGIYRTCNENFGPPSKIGPPGMILAAKSGPPLPISVPPVKLQLVNKLDLDERIALSGVLLGAVKLILFATTNSVVYC